MSRFTYTGVEKGFPFGIPEAEIWDGVTLFGGSPSGSSSYYRPVVGPGTGYPIAFSLQEAAMLFYRLKYLKCSFKWTVKDVLGEEHGYMEAMFTIGAELVGVPSDYRSPKNNERELLIEDFGRGGGVSGNETGTFSYSETGSDGAVLSVNAVDFGGAAPGYLMHARLFGETSAPMLRDENNNFYPSIFFSSNGDSGGVWGTGYYFSSLGEDTGQVFSIFGQSIPIYGFMGTLNYFTTEAIKWWGYDGEFDTSTGIQL